MGDKMMVILSADMLSFGDLRRFASKIEHAKFSKPTVGLMSLSGNSKALYPSHTQYPAERNTFSLIIFWEMSLYQTKSDCRCADDSIRSNATDKPIHNMINGNDEKGD